MGQQTSPSLSRAPMSIRKMVQIIKDPVIFTTITTVTALAAFGAWYYYSNKSIYQTKKKEKRLFNLAFFIIKVLLVY